MPRLFPFLAVLGLVACDQPLDFDLRGVTGGFSTAEAATTATTDRPRPDDRGVISYPGYQVAVARRGDTVTDVAARVGLPEAELARFNGIAPDVGLRAGEVIALPRRVTDPSPATGAIGTGPIRPAPVDVTELAGAAIDAAPDTTPAPAPARPARVQTGEEPIRHRVERGETAYTIARLYQVPVRSLAEWNGLGSDFAIREGQFLLIPTARAGAPAPADPIIEAPTTPGAGSPTPLPPSAATPLPDPERAAQLPEPEAPAADVGRETPSASRAEMSLPVQGSIIRTYRKGRNDGINIQAAPGTPVKAAADGTVAAITRSADGVPIVVIRHASGLLTVYANVTDVTVAKDDTVRRGTAIAKLRGGEDNYVHFEVRDGFDSVDPETYLEG
ncbi:MAG: LysM peptidoglycan-binding domain-containing M23 family metallopeptidase [Pseudomonadota bacterium]